MLLIINAWTIGVNWDSPGHFEIQSHPNYAHCLQDEPKCCDTVARAEYSSSLGEVSVQNSRELGTFVK